MPHVVNGIGTWYWGKRRIHAVHATCQHCGRAGELLSYDTRLYFVVLFIPVFPLRRKRVLEQCPTCKRHTVVGYRDWQRLRRQELPEAVEALRQAPRERERAMLAIHMAARCQDHTVLDDIASIIESSRSRDAEVQAMLGEAYAYFSLLDGAEHAFRTALAIEDRCTVRDSLAKNLLLQSRPDEAWDLISNPLDEEGSHRESLALLVAESYQAWGMHDEALTILDTAVSTFPSLEQDRAYKKLRKATLKHRGSEKRLKPKLLTAPKKAVSRGSSFASHVPVAVACLVILAAVSWFVLTSLSEAQDRVVHVVNGLSLPYRVSINGKTHNLGPHSLSRIHLPEGNVNVSVLGAGVPIPDQSCLVHTNFFSRLFIDPVFIINPDRTAMIIWEEVEYSENPGPDSDYKYKYYNGEFFLSLVDVSYRFEAFPDTVTLASDSSAHRSRVGFLRDWQPPMIAGALLQDVGQAAAASYLRRKVELDPEDPLALGILPAVLKMPETMDILKRLCRQRPIRVEAHRYYQHLTDISDPEADFEREYRDLLAEDPDDVNRMYLLGRVLADKNESEELFQRATAGSAPSARAFAALAYNRLATGEFEEALRLAKRSMKLAPDNQQLRQTPLFALSALGRYEEALNLYRNTYRSARAGSSEEIYYLARLGNRRILQQRINAIVKEAAAQGGKAAADNVRRILDFTVAYANGDLDNAAKQVEPLQDPIVSFARAAITKDWNGAQAALDSQTEPDTNAKLLLSVVLRDAGKTDDADKLLTQAIELLQGEGATRRRTAAWLGGASPFEPGEVLRVAMEPDRKVVLLVAMGQLFPEHRDAFWEMAGTLNFDRRFPYWTIRSLIEGGQRGS